MARRRFGHAPRVSLPPERTTATTHPLVAVGAASNDASSDGGIALERDARTSGIELRDHPPDRSLGALLVARGAFVGIEAAAPVAAAARMMAARRVSALPVVEDGAVVGVVTERDVVRRLVARGRDAETFPVGDVMSGDVVVAYAKDSPERGLRVLHDSGRRHLLVIDGEDPARCRVLGLLSASELVERAFLASLPARASLPPPMVPIATAHGR